MFLLPVQKRSIFLLLVSSFVWRQTNSCCQAITALYKTEAFWLPIKFFILHCSLTLSPTRGVSVTYFIRRSPIFLISTTDLATRNRVIVLFHPHTFWDLLDWKDTITLSPSLAYTWLWCVVSASPVGFADVTTMGPTWWQEKMGTRALSKFCGTKQVVTPSSYCAGKVTEC